MTSRIKDAQETYVWFFPSDKTTPVVVGRIARDGMRYIFNYGRSWLASPEAMPLYLPELPLRQGAIPPNPPLTMAGCLRDAAPDAWGRRVIINRLTGLRYRDTADLEFDELTYLLHSSSDRVGALDFQESADTYVARQEKTASLEELQEAVQLIADGKALPPDLSRALFHGSSVGGARPKALIGDDTRRMIAKFSMPTDSYSVVKAEFIAMRLAKEAGLHVADVALTHASGKDVLLIERFDRVKLPEGWGRRAMVSALTLFGLDEMQARYAHYGDLADIIKARFAEPRRDLHELFRRIAFNILVGNTDDHARNHAAFWHGDTLSLTPAYDICPQPRTGGEASQSMLIQGNDRSSRLSTCLAAAAQFHLTRAEAQEIINHQIDAVKAHWSAVCDQAELPESERAFLWQRQFLNPFIFDG